MYTDALHYELGESRRLRMRGMSKKNLVVGAAFVGVLASLGVAQSVMEKAAAAQGKMGVQAPYFEVDPMWPKPTNRHWLYGNVIGVVKATFNQMAALETMGTLTQNINYAVKSDQVLPMLKQTLGDQIKVSNMGKNRQDMPKLITKFEKSVVLVEAE